VLAGPGGALLWSGRTLQSAMSEVMPFDPDQRQMIQILLGAIGTSARLADVGQVLLQQIVETAARAQPELFDRDALLDPEQNAAPSISSGDADARLIGSISTMKFEHSVLWSSITLLVSVHIWSRQRTETR
jgi:hypothetical protein